jgi:hypothetical protein
MPVVRSHDLFAIEGPLDKKAVIGNPPLRVFVEVAASPEVSRR